MSFPETNPPPLTHSRGEVLPEPKPTPPVPGRPGGESDAAAGRPTALSAAPDALGLLRALRRRWGLALTLALLAGPVGAALGWFLLPSVMPAKNLVRTTLHVAARQPHLFSNAGADRVDFSSYQRTQIALVKSRLVLNAALRSPKVADLEVVRKHSNPAEWLETAIKADFSVAPEILTISMTGSNPDELTVLIDAVREAYLQEIVNREQTEQNTRLERLKQFYNAKEEILRRKRQTLRELAQSIGSGDSQTLARTQQYMIERLAAMQHELLQVQSDLRKAQVEAAADQAREKATGDAILPEALVDEQVRHDPVVEEQRKEITRLEGEVARVKGVLTNPDDDHPALAKYAAALEAAKKALEARQKDVRPLIVEQLRERAKYEAQLGALQRREKIAVLQELEKSLAKDVKGLEGETDRVKKGSVNVEAMREDVGQEEDTVKKIGAEVQALTLELQAPARVTLLEGATVTESPDQKVRAAGMAGIGGFGLALLGVAFWEFRARRVSDADEVVEGLGIRLVGSIPDLSRRRTRPGALAGARPGYSLLTESIDVTRSMLVRTARVEGLRVVMITSALEGEGKTSVSGHLALSLARAGFRTLLIDGDLRRPSLHRLFEVGVQPGFNEVLRGEADLAEVIRPTSLDQLWLVPGGRWRADSMQALAQERVKEVLHAVREQYDFILVDSSPVLPVVDPLLIGQQVDAALFSVLREVSRLPSIHAAYERVSAFGIRVLGAVINGTTDGVYSATYQGALEAE